MGIINLKKVDGVTVLPVAEWSQAMKDGRPVLTVLGDEFRLIPWVYQEGAVSYHTLRIVDCQQVEVYEFGESEDPYHFLPNQKKVDTAVAAVVSLMVQRAHQAFIKIQRLQMDMDIY